MLLLFSERMKYLFLYLLLLLLASAQAEITITEVMYNPGGDDNNREFVEISGTNNLTGYLVGDTTSNDSLLLLFAHPGNTSLIVEEEFNYSGLNASIYSVGKTIGNNLNDEDTIFLYAPNGNLTARFSYTSELGGQNNNRSLEKREDSSWGESITAGGTPGQQNSIFFLSVDYEFIVLSEVFPNPFDEDDHDKPLGEWLELYNEGTKAVYLGDLVFKDENDDNVLYITENSILSPDSLILLPDDYVIIYRDSDSDFNMDNIGYDEVRLFYKDELLHSMNYQETVEGMSWSNIEGDWYLTAPTPDAINEIEGSCDWLLLFQTNTSIFRGEDFEFEVLLRRYFGLSLNITVQGEITDIHGNVLRTYAPWTNEEAETDKKVRYSPNLAPGTYQIHFWIVNEELACADDDPSDNDFRRVVAINPSYQKTTPTLNIEELESETAAVSWGGQVVAHLTAYTGKEKKSTLYFWAEKGGRKISEKGEISLDNAFQEYSFSLPLSIIPNCDEAITNGEALFIVEGMGEKEAKNFAVSGNIACGDASIPLPSSTPIQLLRWPVTFTPGGTGSAELQLSSSETHTYNVWGYLYRGNACYSCAGSTREGNQQTVIVPSGDQKMVTLPFTVNTNVAAGDYKLKIRVQRDDRATPTDFVKNVTIVAQQETVLEIPLQAAGAGSYQQLNFSSSARPGFIIYQSSSAKSFSLVPFLLLFSFVIVIVVLYLPKKS